MLLLSGLLFVSYWGHIGVLGQCPPLGSTLPSPRRPSGDSTVQGVAAAIELALQNITGSWNETAVSIIVGSTNDSTPLIEFNNNPSVFNASGSHTVDVDTGFLIASISKLFTALGIRQLSGKISLSDPITKYVPALLQLGQQVVPQDMVTTTDWESITIEALLSHLSGISEDLADSDLSSENASYTAQLGLPELNETEEGVQCGSQSYQRPCTDADFFAYFGQKYPAYAPFTTPVYSNIGYYLLGLAIENVTGTSYAQYVEQAIINPLNLTHTTIGPPANLNSTFITAGTSWGATSLGFEDSSGGIFSSARDLYTLGDAILSHQAGISASQTRAWLKPKTFTSSLGTFVGEVWEIARGTNLTGGDGHVVDFYTKGGNFPDYSQIIALVPDYDLVFVILSAGPDTSSGVVQVMLSQIVEALIPAIDAAAKTQAKEIYAGTYTATSNATITLSVDSGPGLLASNFSVNGIDVVEALGSLAGVDPGVTTLRLYPTDLKAGKQTAWQGVYNYLTPAETAAVDELLFFEQGSCQSWSELALESYGLRPLDQFVFTMGENGTNVEVDARAWRTVMSQ